MSMSLNEKLCHSQHSQLLIIDIQDRLASAMPKDVLDKVVKNSNVLINAANELDIPVIHSEQYPKGLGNTVAEITDNLPETGVSIEKTCLCCL